MDYKFEIPIKPLTTSKTIRFPNNLIEDIEEVIRGKNCTFSLFVIEALRTVLTNIKENN